MKSNKELDMVTSEMVVKVLNEMLALDREATQNLFAYRALVNNELAEHPTVQVRQNNTVGIIGVINGMLGEGGEPLICVDSDDVTDEIREFRVL